jgi:hypothetical protein
MTSGFTTGYMWLAACGLTCSAGVVNDHNNLQRLDGHDLLSTERPDPGCGVGGEATAYLVARTTAQRGHHPVF